MLAMPLGGIAAGSVSLGGRGQLRDWELFNRPDKGRSPEYAFASIWAQAGSRKPVAHVLEARLMPPYEGPDGLGSKNAPGLSRLESATFTGEFPIAQIAFHDSRLPVNVSLDAFSPFIPLDADAAGVAHGGAREGDRLGRGGAWGGGRRGWGWGLRGRLGRGRGAEGHPG